MRRVVLPGREGLSLVTCPSCAQPLDRHTLSEARACIEELAKREPPYCRLTGPTDPDEWARAVAARRLPPARCISSLTQRSTKR